MSKILTDKEMTKIIHNAVHGDAIDCADAYQHFLEDLANLICDHFGGDRGEVTPPSEDLQDWTVAFRHNENVPTDGGVFKDFDKDVTWKDGREV